MKLKEIMHMLEELCPRSFAMSWDNAGLQVGYSDKEVHTIALALDCTSEVIAKAAAHKADLILTHHPLRYAHEFRRTRNGRCGGGYDAPYRQRSIRGHFRG